MLIFRLLRFRSLQRDSETDQARLVLVKRTVRSSITNAQSELNGVRSRLKHARQLASLHQANIDNGHVEESHGSDLTGIQERLVAAETRVAQLMRHLAALHRIESIIDRELGW
jgi:hypothetical protein